MGPFALTRPTTHLLLLQSGEKHLAMAVRGVWPWLQISMVTHLHTYT